MDGSRLDVAAERLGDVLEHRLHFVRDAGKHGDVLDHTARGETRVVQQRPTSVGDRRLGLVIEVDVGELLADGLDRGLDVRKRTVVGGERTVERLRHRGHRDVVGRAAEPARHDDGVEALGELADLLGD